MSLQLCSFGWDYYLVGSPSAKTSELLPSLRIPQGFWLTGFSSHSSTLFASLF